jgi:hypothetical protein
MTQSSGMKAYSYVRFSSPEQMRGESLRRQLEKSSEYAEKSSVGNSTIPCVI